MNFDSYQSHQSPPPKSTGCRLQNTWLGSKVGESQLKGQPAKDARRRRMELRQIRSISKAKSAADPSTSENDVVCLKNGRDETQKEAVEETPAESARGGGMRCRSYGKISVVGRRREMEDMVAVELGFLKRGDESYDLFGIYHGHGRQRVAQACCQTLHKILAEIVEAEESSKEIEWEKVMAAGFNMMEAEVNRKGVSAASTAVVALVGKNEVAVAANCGGARVVLSRGETAVRLLEEATDPKEAGGKVKVIRRSEADELLIVGSEGLWDVISNEAACEIGRSYCHGRNRSSQKDAATAAAAVMAKLALARGSKANISIVVVDFKQI